MKKINLFAMSLLALLMVCFTACENKNFIKVDHSDDIVGTWTILEEDQAEAMVINPDGTFEVTGVMKGGSLYESKGTIKVVNNKVSLVFEGDNEVIEGRLELVSGKSMSIVINEEYDVHLTYDYCENDLSDEIVGTWVCNDGLPNVENDMAIISYSKDGKMTMTAPASDFIAGDFMKQESEYKVVGNLVFKILPKENVPEGITPYIVSRMIYTPNGTTLGDILTENQFVYSENGLVELTSTFLRVKETLNLTGKVYDYSSAYVSNAKGKDDDFTITTGTFNMANINAGDFDVMFRSVLYCLEFPNATTLKQHFYIDGADSGYEIPITVEGNKVTLNMSAGNSAYRNVEMYMFQSANDSQLHIYMPTQSFVNYFANLEIVTMLIGGKIDLADTAAVEKVFTNMDARVESINLSLLFKVRN